MFQLVYASTATQTMTSKDLSSLLQQARVKNDQLGVTGMLLYRDERFLQVLEGAEGAVRRLYRTIRGDERHTTVITLRERLIDAREFSDWTMGFADLDRVATEDLPEGHASLFDENFTSDHFRRDAGQAHQALLQFREATR